MALHLLEFLIYYLVTYVPLIPSQKLLQEICFKQYWLQHVDPDDTPNNILLHETYKVHFFCISFNASRLKTSVFKSVLVSFLFCLSEVSVTCIDYAPNIRGREEPFLFLSAISTRSRTLSHDMSTWSHKMQLSDYHSMDFINLWEFLLNITNVLLTYNGLFSECKIPTSACM